MKQKLYLLVLFLLLSSTVFAGITGKIAGQIVDSETGQALPGVNVVVEGTTMGAASDVNGNYVILNVPVGIYQLKFSMIGYTAITVKNVKVSIDITTTINFKLTPEVLEAAEGVIIVAERPIIQKDEVSTRHFVSSEEIELQPVDSFEEIAKNQAGVVGNHFRGGRTGEVLVLIDGIPIKDPAGTYSDVLGSFTSDIPEYGIQELEVSLGGFSAEYGNVQSGILNLALKEGSSKYTGRLRLTSNDFGKLAINQYKSLTSRHLLGDSLGRLNPWKKEIRLIKKIYEFNLNGPEPLTTFVLPQAGIKVPGTLSFSLSAELTDNDRGYYINQQSFDQSYQGKLTYRATPNHKLAIGGVFSGSSWDQFYFPAARYGPAPDYPLNEYNYVDNDTLYHYAYVLAPDRYRERQGEIINSPGQTPAGLSYNTIKNYYVAGMQEYLWDYHKNSNIGYAIWTHTLSPRTFYEIRLNSFYSKYHYATRDVDDRDGDGDTREDLVWDINKPGPHPIYRERDINYWWIRGDDPGFRDQSSWTKNIKADIVSQVTSNHLIKGGVDFNLNRTRVENLSWTLDLSSIRKDIWDRENWDLAAFVQDKLEFAGIIAIVGLRYDVFDPNGRGDAIYYPGDYNYPYTTVDEKDIPIFTNPKKASRKSQLSPRIGISHPITDRDVLHFTYGHYFQRPDGYFLYRNYKIQALTKVGNYIGNPDLKPEKTVAYEVGVEHQFTDDLKGTITGYYKDVSNLMDWRKYIGRSIQNIELNIFTNADYGNVKGLEFTFNKRVGKFFGGSVNYTFSVAKGRSSNYLSGYGSFTDVKRMNILDFDQTHTVNATLIAQTPKDLGPQFAFIRPMANWQASLQFYYGSGLPYSSYGSGKVNDKRLPWTSTTDIKLIREFNLSKVNFDLFLDIFNLFDRKNVNWIGSTLYYDIKDDPSIIMRDDITGAYIRNPQVYSQGRQIRFGLAVQF